MSNTKTLKEIPVGETFKIGELEFIKFSDENGVTTAVSKDVVFNLRFGDNNDFSQSDILKKLTEKILPAIEKAIGAENVLEHETDLLSLDGSAKHGVLRSKISIPTFDFYRNNRAVFEGYKLDGWWWLSTPDRTSEYYNDRWSACVSPSGDVYKGYIFGGIRGVRPFLCFVSSISVSYDE